MISNQPRYNSLFLSRIAASAERLGASCKCYDRLNGRIAVVTGNGNTAFFGAAPIKLWPFNSSLWMSVANDKELVIRILAEHAISVPKTRIAFSDVSKYRHLARMPCSVDQVLSDLQYPVVVKPNKGRSAEGLAFLYEPSRVSDAVAYAGKYDNAILFQEMVEGRDFRILVLDGEPLVLIERGVRTLQGDGVSSVSQLVAGSRVHESVASKPGELISLQSYVEAFGDTIVEKGFVIKIHPASNLALGGSVLDCHLEVSNIWKKLCRCVSRCLPLRFFALDCRGDPDVADRLFVLEVNANPGIEFLYRHSRQTGDRIVDILVEKALAASKQ